MPKPATKTELALRLSRLIVAEKKIPFAALAALTGMSRNTVKGYIRDGAIPKERDSGKILKLLGCLLTMPALDRPLGSPSANV